MSELCLSSRKVPTQMVTLDTNNVLARNISVYLAAGESSLAALFHPSRMLLPALCVVKTISYKRSSTDGDDGIRLGVWHSTVGV